MHENPPPVETPDSDLDDFDDALDIEALDREEAEKEIVKQEEAVKSLEEAFKEGADTTTPEEEDVLFGKAQENRERK